MFLLIVTGTPTGDPIEASAIRSAFFGTDHQDSGDDDILYVGSIKTVIGHTEGTAGIAAIMKASLALQHEVIPPNMLFNHLSPAVQPFYGNLQILSAAKPWPQISEGVPRRASVNSFGELSDAWKILHSSNLFRVWWHKCPCHY